VVVATVAIDQHGVAIEGGAVFHGKDEKPFIGELFQCVS
jgi:hypothetical protein